MRIQRLRRSTVLCLMASILTGGVDRAYLERIESVRSDAAKIGQDASKEIIDLHNYQ